MSSTPPSVSVVIPAFNEEGAVGAVVAELKQLYPAYEILVVDDGSTDRTAEVAAQAGAKVISHGLNLGYGAALKTGIAKSANEVVAIIDADGSYPVDGLGQLVHHIHSHEMVVGARIAEGAHIPALRRPAKWVLGKLANYLCGTKIPDLNSGLRVFTKAAFQRYQRILPAKFSFTTTLTMAMLTNGHSVKYIPISYFGRKGKSKIRPLRDTFGFALLIARVILYFNPLRVFLPACGLLASLALASLIYDAFWLHNLTDKTVAITLTAVQLAFLGLLADLIDKRME